MPRQMTTDEVRAVLSHGTRTAKVATVMGDGHPHVMPVWFGLSARPSLQHLPALFVDRRV